MSKSKQYYYDADAIKEPAVCKGKIVTLGEKSFSKGQAAGKNVARSGNALKDSFTVGETRNRRTVWTIPTRPFPGAHFAVFPPALVEPCVLAGSRVDDLVLDPFAGSGTVGIVCREHTRRFVGIEINPKYAKMARGRLSDDD
jgi:DNA modification methylase